MSAGIAGAAAVLPEGPPAKRAGVSPPNGARRTFPRWRLSISRSPARSTGWALSPVRRARRRARAERRRTIARPGLIGRNKRRTGSAVSIGKQCEEINCGCRTGYGARAGTAPVEAAAPGGGRPPAAPRRWNAEFNDTRHPSVPSVPPRLPDEGRRGSMSSCGIIVLMGGAGGPARAFAGQVPDGGYPRPGNRREQPSRQAG